MAKLRRRTWIVLLVAIALVIPVVLLAVNLASPVKSTVALIGTFQPQMGCKAWADGCNKTYLQPQADGKFGRTFHLLQGTYQLSISLLDKQNLRVNLSGDEGKQSDLVLPKDLSVHVEYDPVTELTTLTALGPKDPAPIPTQSIRPARTTEQFYFIMTDRFANGDATNDKGGLTGPASVTGYDPTSQAYYHGGDLKGILSKLDYIQGLGTTAIWLTPAFKNKPVQGTGSNASAGYHGYWITDFTRIDPHLGTNADMKTLVDAVHARGMHLYFDIIANHTADVITYPGDANAYRDEAESPYKDASGQPIDDHALAVSKAAWPAMDPAASFPYVPLIPPAEKNLKVPAWLNDPTMYHNRGDSTWAGESNNYGDFYGLDDLFTERPEVVKGFEDIYSAWVDMGVDGFRIDTAKHVNMEFWQQFSPAILAHAAAKGNNDFFMFGEVSDKDAGLMSEYTTRGKLQATLDFATQDAILQVCQLNPPSRLQDSLGNDDLYTDADSNAYELPTFLGNHDMGRIGMMIKDMATGADLVKLDEMAHSMLFLLRGQPVVYYGDEQGFTGNGGDQLAREDMFATKTKGYADESIIGGTSGSKNRFETSAPLYKHIAALAKLRKDNPALVDGAEVFRHADQQAGILSWSRIKDGQEYVVVVDSGANGATADFTIDSRDTTLEPIFGPGQELTVGADGKVSVTADAYDVTVYRAKAKMPAPLVVPKATLVPVNASDPTGRIEFKATLDQPVFANVAFQVRALGDTDWATLGVDDNPDYRVYADLSGYPRGTYLQVRVVVTDSSGAVGVTPASLVVGEAPRQ